MSQVPYRLRYAARLQAVKKSKIEACRIITGANKLCSIAKLYQATGCETLEYRRNKQKLIAFYKMSNSLSPSYLSRLMPPQVRENSEYLLRNSSNTSTIHANSNLYYNSFLPSVIRSEVLGSIPGLDTYFRFSFR